MTKSTVSLALVAAILLAAAATLAAQTAAKAPSAAPVAAPAAPMTEAQLLAVLTKSDSSFKDKCDACRELAHLGTKAAVPVLAPLLTDEKMNHMARYALEPIADPSVDDAFRDALGKCKGLPLVGVIGSVGVRRDAKATDALAKFLSDADPQVAQIAARSLGCIATPQAVKAMEDALANPAQAGLPALCEGLFRCGEALAAKGQLDAAREIYDRVRGLKNAPHQIRTAALRGAILSRGNDGLALLMEAVRGEYAQTLTAVRTSQEMRSADVTKALAAELVKLPSDKQLLLVQTLGIRGDAAAVPGLLALAKDAPANVRIAAIRSLAQLCDASCVPALAALTTNADAEVAAAAQLALASFPGKEADGAIVGMLASKDTPIRIVAINIIGQRRIMTAMPAILKSAADADESIRIASLKVVGDLATMADLPALLDLLVKAAAPAELTAAEASLSTFCARQAALESTGKVVVTKAVYGALPGGPSADVTAKVAEMVKGSSLTVDASNANFGDTAPSKPKSLCVQYTVDGKAGSKTVAEGESLSVSAGAKTGVGADAICAALEKAPAKAKMALLRVLRSVGGPKALAAVKAATTSTDAEIKDTAIHALCDWTNVEALDDLRSLAKTATDAKVKTLALRGTIRLIRIQDIPDDQKLASLKDAMGMATRTDEKKLALAALGDVPTLDALALVTPNLADPQLKEEACLAAVAIGDKLVTKCPNEVAAAMKQVLAATKNAGIRKKANAVLAQVKTK